VEKFNLPIFLKISNKYGGKDVVGWSTYGGNIS